MNNKCKCGCGRIVINKKSKYLHGHNTLGRRWAKIKIKRRCKCACNQITDYGNKYLHGHNAKKINQQYKIKHGLCNHKLYRTWISMNQRCYNKNRDNYKNWGGRGIRVCIRWKKSFISFYHFAIDNGWQKGLQIDRRDNDGNYTPNNCRFVTAKINANNRRNNIIR